MLEFPCNKYKILPSLHCLDAPPRANYTHLRSNLYLRKCYSEKFLICKLLGIYSMQQNSNFQFLKITEKSTSYIPLTYRKIFSWLGFRHEISSISPHNKIKLINTNILKPNKYFDLGE